MKTTDCSLLLTVFSRVLFHTPWKRQSDSSESSTSQCWSASSSSSRIFLSSCAEACVQTLVELHARDGSGKRNTFWNALQYLLPTRDGSNIEQRTARDRGGSKCGQSTEPSKSKKPSPKSEVKHAGGTKKTKQEANLTQNVSTLLSPQSAEFLVAWVAHRNLVIRFCNFFYLFFPKPFHEYRDTKRMQDKR